MKKIDLTLRPTPIRRGRRFGIYTSLFLAVAAAPTGALAQATGGFVIDTTSREDVRCFYNTLYTSSDGVPMDSSANIANCVAGTNSTAFQNAVLRRVNWFRAMAGIPANVTLDPIKNSKAQQAALMMARNADLDHNPPPSWSCYTSDGWSGAQNGNLFLGQNGPPAVSGFVDENNDLGHRRWILFPPTQVMGTGDVPAQGPYAKANCLWVFDEPRPRPALRDGFVSWPPPGFVPYQVAVPNWATWSFSYPGADFSAASITMQSNGMPFSITVHQIGNGYGDNAIAWEPATWTGAAPAADVTYSVTVSGVQINGGSSNFNYQVTVFDPAVPGPDYQAPTITGPTEPAVGQNNQYTFAESPSATGYQWRQSRRLPASVSDGAENGSSRFVVSASTDQYSIITTSPVASGTYAFHLCHPDGEDQTLTFTNEFFPSANSVLTFKSRRTWASASQVAKVQASSDDGQTWVDLFSQPGNDTSGEAIFTNRTVSLAGLAGKAIRLRFNYHYTGSGGWYPDTDIGWYFDDIVLSDIEELEIPVILAASGGSFDFNPPQAGKYNLSVRAVFCGQVLFQWGPSLLVTAVTGSALPGVTTLAASGLANNAATLNGSVNPNGSGAVGYFVYGTTTSYGQTNTPVSLGSGNTAAPLSLPLSWLIGGTAYHFRSVGSNSAGVVYGDDVSFTTPLTFPPYVGKVASANPGQGLDLQGNFVYAVNVGENGAAGLIGDALFTADNVPGVGVSAPGGQIYTFNTWASPNYGAGDNNTRLAQAMSSIRYTTAPAKLTVTLGNLTPGHSFKLQLLFIEGGYDRAFNVAVNGNVIAPAFRLLDYGPIGTSVVVTHTFVAAGSTATVELGGGTPSGLDPNPTLSAFTLEALTSATATTLLHYRLNATDAATVAGGSVPSLGTYGPGVTGSVGTPVALSADIPTLGVPPGAGNRSINGGGTGGILLPGTLQLNRTNIANAGGFTFETWFKWNGGGILNSLIDYAGTEKLIRDSAVTGPGMYGVATIGDAAANQWHYVAAVFTPSGPIAGNGSLPGDYAFYLDSVTPTAFASNVVIGAFGDSLDRTIAVGMHPEGYSSDYFNGLLYEPRVTLGALPGSALLFKPRIVLTGMTKLGNGSFQFGFSGSTGASYTVLATTDLGLPVSAWSNLGGAVETPPGSGQYQFTDTQAPSHSQRFYQVRTP